MGCLRSTWRQVGRIITKVKVMALFFGVIIKINKSCYYLVCDISGVFFSVWFVFR